MTNTPLCLPMKISFFVERRSAAAAAVRNRSSNSKPFSGGKKAHLFSIFSDSDSVNYRIWTFKQPIKGVVWVNIITCFGP